MGREDLIDKFNVVKLEAILYDNYKDYRAVILEHAKSIGVSKIRIITYGKWFKISKISNRVLKKFSRGFNNVHRFVNVIDIKEAVDNTKTIINI